jgi:hypothetical protein
MYVGAEATKGEGGSNHAGIGFDLNYIKRLLIIA